MIFDPTSYLHETDARCPVCRMSNADQVVTDRYGFETEMATCSNCGLGYLVCRMTRDGYAALYAGNPSPYRRLVWEYRFPGFDYVPAAATYQLIESQRIYAKRLVRWLYTQRDLLVALKGRPLLDAGGSTGRVGAAVRQFGAFGPLTVLDPAGGELPAGVRTIEGVLEDPIAGGPYGFIVCAETLDHVLDPLAALRNLRTALDPDGILFVDVLDVTQFRRPQYKIDHPLYWTPQAFQTALNCTGWRPVATGRLDRWHYAALCQPA